MRIDRVAVTIREQCSGRPKARDLQRDFLLVGHLTTLPLGAQRDARWSGGRSLCGRRVERSLAAAGGLLAFSIPSGELAQDRAKRISTHPNVSFMTSLGCW